MGTEKSKADFEYADTVFARDIDSRVFQAITYKCLCAIEGIELVGGNILDNLLGRDTSEKIKGIYIDQDQKNHSVNIKVELNIAYGVAIPEKSEEIQSKVAKEVCRLTGLHVASVHVVFKNLISQRPIDLTAEVEKDSDEDPAVLEYTDDF